MHNILQEWINPMYLDDQYISTLRETARCKPEIKYLVLDNFLRVDKIEEMINRHKDLSFSPPLEPILFNAPNIYDANTIVVEDNQDMYYGSELFFSKLFHNYLVDLIGVSLKENYETQFRLRSHDPDAKGFWIHTDTGHMNRVVVAMGYFNKDWIKEDGGLLQLWRVEEVNDPSAPVVNPNTFTTLNHNTRINTIGVGGDFPYGGHVDLLKIDQINPAYNRVVLINLQANPSYHSVTPSNGRVREGFVLWLANPKED